MGLIATETGGGKDRPLIQEGVHLAVCYLIADLGTHHSEMFDKDAHKVVIGWEIPGERGTFHIDGKDQDLPLVASKTFTLSLHKKAALRQVLEAWRGQAFTDEELKGFDLKAVLGAPCQLQIMHTKKGEKTYANIGAVMPLMKGVQAPQGETAHQWFSLSEGVDLPDHLPEWVRKEIEASKEWQAMLRAGGTDDTTTGVDTLEESHPFPPPTDADMAEQDEENLPF